METNDLTAKLEAKFPSIASVVKADGFAAAADFAGKLGVWGIWAQCREAAGLPADDAARNELIAAVTAARKARFSK